MKYLSLVVLLSSVSVRAATTQIVLVAPSGGEVFTVGQTQKVRLADSTKAKLITIELSRDGGATFAPLGQINNLIKSLLVPKNVLSFTVTAPASSNCVIRASSSGFAVETSGAFTISTSAVGSPAAIPTTLPPSGPAGGALGGTYPNPTLVTAIPTTLPPSGPAGGALKGTYPNPGLAIPMPTTLPPSGPAGGDLKGTYPNPKISSGASSSGFVLEADGLGGAGWQVPGWTGDFTAGDIKADIFSYTGPVVRYYSIPYAAFTSTTNSPTMDKMNEEAFKDTGSDFSACTPVHLPDGAYIGRVEVNVIDNDPNRVITVFMARSLRTDNTIENIETFETTTDSSATQTIGGSSSNSVRVVDNLNYSYSMFVDDGSAGTFGNTKILNALVTYYVSSPLP